MGVTLNLILIFITYHLNVELCQSYSKPTNWKYTRKSETPVRSFGHRQAFQQPVMYDEQLKYIAALIKHPETREAQQWQAAVEIQPRSKDRLSAEIQVGHPTLKKKRNHLSQTKATSMVEKEHQRKIKHSKKLKTRRQAKKNKKSTERILRKEFDSLYNRNMKDDEYYGNRHAFKNRYEASNDRHDFVDTYNATEIIKNSEPHARATTNDVLGSGVSSDKKNLEKDENKVNIQYAMNLELNQQLGDYLRNKIAAFTHKIRVLRMAGVPFLK